MSTEVVASRAEFVIEAEVTSALDECLADTVFSRTFRAGGEEYEAEECEEPDDDWVLVRKSDGARFLVEFDVFVRGLAGKVTPDPDAIPHIPGQEALPL